MSRFGFYFVFLFLLIKSPSLILFLCFAIYVYIHYRTRWVKETLAGRWKEGSNWCDLRGQRPLDESVCYTGWRINSQSTHVRDSSSLSPVLSVPSVGRGVGGGAGCAVLFSTRRSSHPHQSTGAVTLPSGSTTHETVDKSRLKANGLVSMSRSSSYHRGPLVSTTGKKGHRYVFKK